MSKEEEEKVGAKPYPPLKIQQNLSMVEWCELKILGPNFASKPPYTIGMQMLEAVNLTDHGYFSNF
jgi:hypothetical protein